MTTAISDPKAHAGFCKASTSYRLQHSNVIVDGTVPLDFNRYPYIPQMLDEEWPVIDVIKGAQMGFSIAFIMKALEAAKSGKYRGIGYLFPTEAEVGDFAKSRFGPMMTNNPEVWGKYVKDTDSAALKRVGDTFLFFRGVGQRGGATKESTSRLKGFPNDILCLDESDEMDDKRKDTVLYRLDGTLTPQLWRLSTPTLPGYGVDYDYKQSDQRVWMWKCRRCNEWTCLDLEYPDCIALPTNEDPFYLCVKCREPLDRIKGEWVARQTDVLGHAGFWASQLNSPTQTALQIVLKAEKALETGRRREFENQTLARAFAEVDEQITEEQLVELLTDESKPLMHEGPACMGVDPGKPHWYEVRVKLSEKDSLVIDRGKAETYDDLHKVWERFNCEAGVMDQGYDPSAVQAFCEAHPGCYGGLYVGGKTTSPDWNHREKLVKMGRTRTLDDAFNVILQKRVKHVRKDEFWKKHFVPQMLNLKRTEREVNRQTKEVRAEWVVTGGQKNDHLRHADAYCNLALERCGLARTIQRGVMKRQNRTQRRRSAMTM